MNEQIDWPIQFLPEEALDDIIIVVHNSSKLRELQECLSTVKSTIDLPKIAFIIARKLGIPDKKVSTIIISLLNLHNYRRIFNMDAKDFASQMWKCLSDLPEEKRDNITVELWKKAEADILTALSPDNALAILEKSIGLGYSHQNVLVNVRLITDIRPVFNDDATKIVKMVTTNLLMLDYFDGTASKRLHITVDASDVERLKQLCDRAQRKASVVLDDFKGYDWETSIIGEGEDE